MKLRYRSTQDTLKILSSYIHRAGIARVADLSYLDSCSHLRVYSAIRPNSKSISISMGKSLDKIEAQCGAIIESIETYFAEQVVAEIIDKSQNELVRDGKVFVDINKLGYSTAISKDQKINWCLGRTLLTNKEIFVPHVSVSLDSTMLISALIGQNSDGIASGSNFEEALIYSFLELIERQSIRNHNVTELADVNEEEYKNLGLSNISYSFHYYQNVFNIPVIACFILNDSPLDNQVITAGYSCHFSKHEALYKSLIEAIQSKIGIISGARDDLDPPCYKFNEINTLPRVSKIKYFNDMYSLDLPLNEQYQKILEILKSHAKDLVVFTYLNEDICILKTFLIDNE